MSDLTTLHEAQETILLAEIAGLLHNIGKLDPNFPPFGYDKETRVDHNLYIPSHYDFKRFAAPSFNLIKPVIQDVLGKRELSQDDIVEAVLAIPDVLAQAHSTKPSDVVKEAWLACIAEAGQRFNRFHWTNGPLYRCYVAERQRERESIQQRLDALESEIEEAKRLSLGPKIGELYEEKSQLAQKDPCTEIYRQEQEAQAALEQRFREYGLCVEKKCWSLPDLLALFWDEFFWKSQEDSTDENSSDRDYERVSLLNPLLEEGQWARLPALLVLSHGEVSGGEKKILLLDEDDREIKAKPDKDEWAFATAFGYDHDVLDAWSLQPRRFNLIEAALDACDAPADRRSDFIPQARDTLRLGLGDTQWPINEIDLWDYASSIAALFKSGVARAVLAGEIPSVGEMKWRFLAVRFDGLGYLSQAHHVSDLIGRRDSVGAALDAVQHVLEATYPLGNEVYRDENGTVFVVPDLKDKEDEQVDVLALTDEDHTALRDLLLQAFAEAESDQAAGAALAGELKPDVRLGPEVRGKQLKLGAYLRDEAHSLTADVAQMDEWWADEQAKGKEICTVCGVRPMGWGVERLYPESHVPYYRQQAEQRKVCGVCMQRRGRRARKWLQDEPETTIWADEVVDANGRFALLVGRFGLKGWLDGSLIPSLQKPSSFARVQRCWESTQRFWETVDEEVVPGELVKRSRLEIEPQNQDELQSGLGKYHTYELQVGGQTLGVVWDPRSRRFILTENLDDLKRRLGFDADEPAVPALQRWLRDHADAPWPVLEPSGYLSPAQSAGASVDFDEALGSETRYVPHIPLLTKPSLFMALVPADKAMEIVQAIKRKYEREMSKVQDRLPLHLGVVIAQRRTPLRAVLEAGRAMLGARGKGPGAGGWEKWLVIEEPQKRGAVEAPAHLTEGNQHFAEWWDVRLERNGRQMTLRVSGVMGDGETEDVWYPHLLTREPAAGEAIDHEDDVIHVKDLQPEQEVYVAPSTFDFEYLDTTARRFEIAYQKTGDVPTVYRPTHPNRPYLLGEVDELAGLWNLLDDHLKTTQWMQVAGLIADKRREWNEPYGILDHPSDTFKRFVRDTLGNAEWKQKPSEDDFERLVHAALYGLLDDVIDLYHEAMKEKSEED